MSDYIGLCLQDCVHKRLIYIDIYIYVYIYMCDIGMYRI